jgi:hypothetical protein
MEMPDNQLKSVSYAEFLCGMNECPSPGAVTLDAQAALSLIKSGSASPFPSMLFAAGAAGFLAASFILPVLFSWHAFPICIFASWASYKVARVLIMKTAWKELLGQGQQSEDTLEALYDRLVEHDLLHAVYWPPATDKRRT